MSFFMSVSHTTFCKITKKKLLTQQLRNELLKNMDQLQCSKTDKIFF